MVCPTLPTVCADVMFEVEVVLDEEVVSVDTDVGLLLLNDDEFVVVLVSGLPPPLTNMALPIQRKNTNMIPSAMRIGCALFWAFAVEVDHRAAGSIANKVV